MKVSDEAKIREVISEAKNVEPVVTHRRKMDRLEAVEYGISFARMMEMKFLPAPREKATDEVLKKLFREKGLTGKQVGKIFGVRDQVGYEWEEMFATPKEIPTPAKGNIRGTRKQPEVKIPAAAQSKNKCELLKNIEAEEIDLSTFDWESLRPSYKVSKYHSDIVRIRKKEIAVATQGRIFQADRVDVGYLKEKNWIAIRGVKAGFKLKNYGSELRIRASVFVRLHELSRCYQVIRESENLIIARAMG